MPIVSDLMTFHADRVPVTATLGDAATLMVDAGISSVIVVDQGKVVGIVTERDVMRAMREHENAALPVADVMTCPVHTVTEDADFRDAYRDAARLGIRHLVVVDHKSRPVGVVTETDFRRHLGLGFFRQMSDVSALMDRSFPTLPAQATLHEALKIMERDKATCVVIVDGLKPLGIVTERDVVRLFLADQGDMQLVSLMSQPLRSVRPDTNLADAAQLMQERRIRHLLVLDDAGDLVGVLSEHGLVRLLELDFVDEVLEERIELAAANETRLKIELDLAHALAVGKDRHDILTTILDVALRFPEFTCGALYWRQPDGAYRLEVQSGIPENLRSKIRVFSAGSPQARLIEAGMLVQNGCGCAGLGCASIQGCISSETCPEELGELLVLPILVGSRPMACLKLAGNGTSKITSVTVLSMKALGSQFSVTLERLAAQEEANQLKDNLSGLFDSLKDLIVVVNTSGNVVHYNRAVTERLGYAPDRLLGCRAVDMHPESTHEQAELYCHEMMAGERNSCLLPFLCADGSSLQVESRMLSGQVLLT